MRSLALRLCIAAALVLSASHLHAQQGSIPGQSGNGSGIGLDLPSSGGYKNHAPVVHDRHVQGTVLGADDKSVANAVVYIKNMRTKETATLLTDEHGNFRIGALDKKSDYQLWAKTDKKIGPTKTLSEYDTRDELTVNLHLE